MLDVKANGKPAFMLVLFKQKIIAKFLEAQDELRRLKKRYAKAGLPLIFIKD